MARLFIGLMLPDDIQDALADLTIGLRGVNWTEVGQFHITLKFLGEVGSHLLGDLVAELAEVQAQPFELQIQGAGHFPPSGEPNVLWAGLKPSDALVRLQRKVEAATLRAGLPAEKRKFHGHVTLARLKGVPADTAARLLAGWQDLRLPPLQVQQFELVQSIRSAGGSEYVVEDVFELATVVG